MGKSKSIEEQQKNNAKFQAYIDDIQQKMSKKAKIHEEEFIKKMKEYYGDEYDTVTHIGAAEKYDFRQLDEVTLKNLQDVIQSAVDAIFPGSKQDQKMKEEAKEAISTVEDFRGMAAAVATNLIMGAMNVLATSSDITFNYSIKSESICPGLTLHVLVANDSYKSSEWFNNTEIVESYVRYELIFSYSQVQTEMDIKYFNYQLDAIAKLEQSVSVWKGKYAEAVMDPAVSDEQLDAMAKRISMVEEQVNNSREEVKKAIDAHNANRIMLANSVPSFSRKRKKMIAAYIQSAWSMAHE